MKTISVRRVRFSSSHQSFDCGTEPHGHDWFMDVAVEGIPTPAGNVAARDVVIPMLAAELHLRDLNKMAVGTFPTPEGIAAWALERLRGPIPGLRSVTVGYDGYCATVEV